MLLPVLASQPGLASLIHARWVIRCTVSQHQKFDIKEVWMYAQE
jgi:hypothetical protein